MNKIPIARNFIIEKMQYIIDGNNLAGCLKILDGRDFDQNLISILKIYFQKRKNKIILVFDGCCRFGDRYQSGALEIIYAGRHQNRGAADDKIIELIEGYIQKESLTLVTDDLELSERAKLLEIHHRKKIEIIKASLLAKKITYQSNDKTISREEKEINPKIEREINEELLRLWT